MFDFQFFLQMTVTIDTATQENGCESPGGFANPVREVVKKLIFYSQAIRKGEGSAPSALTISKCENMDPLKRA